MIASRVYLHRAQFPAQRPGGRHLHTWPVSTGPSRCRSYDFSHAQGASVARIITRKGSKKVANIQAAQPHAARVALCQVDGGRWATLEGTATVLTDPDAVDDAAQRYGARYGRTPAPNPERVVINVVIERAMGRATLP
ncbi:pyridoxamine 5'-phosphate oxidase family protein [Streptomyces malaysiensis]|uniref:pyridoxamine 5'-phosphate oxidase family protein n=1 Tax=Streptomyces malaysiensis TaxID=92644 RepID=UPI0035AEC06B